MKVFHVTLVSRAISKGVATNVFDAMTMTSVPAATSQEQQHLVTRPIILSNVSSLGVIMVRKLDLQSTVNFEPSPNSKACTFAELFYGGEAPTETNHALTCPICGRLGFTESELQTHVAAEHQNSNTEVVSDLDLSEHFVYTKK